MATSLYRWNAYNMPRDPTTNIVIPSQAPSDGGLGSFSYADTSVYGQRGFRAQYFEPYFWWDEHGQLVNRPQPTGRILVGGAGGGARLPGGRKFGSRSLGFDPHGAVLLRLFR